MSRSCGYRPSCAPMNCWCARFGHARITGLRSRQLFGSLVLAKRRLKVMTSSGGAWGARAEEEANGAGEPDTDDADEAEIAAALDRGTVTAAASTAFIPSRRVTR